LLAIPTAWAVAEPVPTTSASSGERVMRLKWTITDVRTDDIAPAGDSSGDTSQFTFKLTGRIGGSADYACTVVGTNYLCNGIIRLSDGDIYVATGPVDQALPAAIQGGTRAYQGIRGQFTKTANPDGTGTYTLTFRK
jgi:hypothetical protein